jgi:L-threonylcarbamoyladenylate synthase
MPESSAPPASSDDIDRAVAVLRAGGLVAFPTETVYGLGADASNPAAVLRVFAVKRRPHGHPLIVHLASAGALDALAVAPSDAARRLAQAFWPGPLTLLVHRRPDRIPDEVTGGGDTVGLRVPAHPVALELLRRFDGVVAAPSANRFGRVSPTTAAHVRADLGHDVDFVLDGGPSEVGVESTIVDCTTDEPEVVRPGGVTFEALADVLGHPVNVWLGDRSVAAPGTLPSHYAPRARVVLVERADDVASAADTARARGSRVAVLAPDAVVGLAPDVVDLGPAGEPTAYARVLYDRLREADARGADVVFVVPPAEHGVGRAVRDRLRRASAREHLDERS